MQSTTGSISWVLLIAILFVLGFAFAAVRRQNRAGVTAIALIPVLTLGMFLMASLFGVRGVQPQPAVHVAYEVDKAHNDAMQAAPAPTTPAMPVGIAEVASDEELASIASAPPKIELDSEIVIGDKAADAKSDRPDWIDAHLGDNQKLITSGPFTTKESCEADAIKQVDEWISSLYEPWPRGAGNRPPLKALRTSKYEETRDTSVGEVHLLYTLAEVAPEGELEIRQARVRATERVAQNRGVRAVSFAGVGVLSLVALTHVVLRSGGRRAKSTTA